MDSELVTLLSEKNLFLANIKISNFLSAFMGGTEYCSRLIMGKDVNDAREKTEKYIKDNFLLDEKNKFNSYSIEISEIIT